MPIRPIPTGRKPAKKSTSPSSACRSLRAGNTLGVLVVQNPRAAHLFGGRGRGAADHRDGAGRDGRLRRMAALAPPGAEPAVRGPVHLKGTALSDGIALGHVVLHEPRVVVTDFIADDVPEEVSAASYRRQPARRSRRTARHGDVEDGGEHRDVSKPTACSPTTAAGSASSRSGGDRPHGRSGRRARAVRHPRAHVRQTDPFLRERLHDLDDLANRLMRQLRPRSGLRARACRRTRSSSRAPWDRRRCSTTIANACAAWCWRGRSHPPRHDRGPRAGDSGGGRDG